MPQFIKVGVHRINLDHVSEVREFGDGSVRVFWDYAVEGDYSASITAHNDFEGKDAKRLLLMLDYYDTTPLPDDYNIAYTRREDILAQLEALDAPADDASGAVLEPEPTGVIQTDEEIAAADRDEIPW